MARMAIDLGKTEDMVKYLKLSRSYKNLYDKEKHAFRPRKEDGSFIKWPQRGKLQEGYGCTECNELQQGWFVPHDIEGMVELMGGIQQTVADLDSMFAHTPHNFCGMYITIMLTNQFIMFPFYIIDWENLGKHNIGLGLFANMLTMIKWRDW